ncbi:MAG: hypothetical protein Q8K37_01570 [Alphaproteobacteria bacterium]|nr:hypothetical protein [Alphaproteobacteria bacterium]
MYILLTIIPFIFLLVLKAKFFKLFLNEFYILKSITKKINKFSFFCFIFMIFFIILWFLQKPLLGNDPLQYFYLSSLIDNMKDVSFYPSTSAVDERGFVVPWSHPLGYPGLLAWGRLGLSQDIGLFFAKISSFSMTFSLALALIIILYKETNRFNFWASLLLLTTPLCLSGALECHVDSSRMLLFLTSFLIVYEYLKNVSEKITPQKDISYFLILGASFGFSWFYHSSGILTYVICMGVLAIVFLINQRKEMSFYAMLKKYIPLIFLTTLIMILIVCVDLYNSFKVHGKILADLENIKIINFMLDEYKMYFDLSRGITTLYDKFIFGILKIFTEIKIFGFVYILFVVSLVLSIRKIKTNNIINMYNFLIFFVFIFYLFVVFTTIMGVGTFSFNPRYLLQIHPIVCLAVAFQMRRIWK